MGPDLTAVVAGAAASVLAAGMLGTFAMLRGFIKEQREANEASRRSVQAIQKWMLVQTFDKAVERGEPITQDEYNCAEGCYEAYHANGGNGAGTLMWERIREHAKVTTGIE